MKVLPNIILTPANYSNEYSHWQGRSITLMGDELKISQSGVSCIYCSEVALYEECGVLVAATSKGQIITTLNGRESDELQFVDEALLLNGSDYYAVIKKDYRNSNFKREVRGMNILNVLLMELLDGKDIWPMWDGVESIEDGVIVIRKAECNFALSSVSLYPATKVLNGVYSLEQVEGHIYKYQKTKNDWKEETIDVSKKLKCGGRK